MTTPTRTADIQTETRPVTECPIPGPVNYTPPKRLVLLVEDEPIVREYMTSLLREQGHRVVRAGDGEEALALFKQIPGMMIDLLLTDIIMPKMNGKELAYRIGLLSPGTKVVFCSAYPEKLASRNGMIDTRVPFLQKPVTPEILAAKMRAILEEPQEIGRAHV